MKETEEKWEMVKQKEKEKIRIELHKKMQEEAKKQAQIKLEVCKSTDLRAMKTDAAAGYRP